MEVSTHLPVSRYLKHFEGAGHRFVLGSNLLKGRMGPRSRQWDVGLATASLIGPVVLLGVGWWQYSDPIRPLSRLVYGKVLSREYRHSVRDGLTESRLKALGFSNVLNTACPSMWDLTPEHCVKIPAERADVVVTTITDYNRHAHRDRHMLQVLKRNYREVHVWLQGLGDERYLNELLVGGPNLRVVGPALADFDRLLEDEVDYVGTRLHAGIRALQKGRRSLIVSVDNRAEELHRDFGLPILSLGSMDSWESQIRTNFETCLRLPEENIRLWRGQYGLA